MNFSNNAKHSTSFEYTSKLQGLLTNVDQINTRLEHLQSYIEDNVEIRLIVRKNQTIYKLFQNLQPRTSELNDLKENVISDVKKGLWVEYQALHNPYNSVNAANFPDFYGDIWRIIGDNYRLHQYTVINYWVNRHNRRKAFTKGEDQLILNFGLNLSCNFWLALDSYCQIPPFEAFKRFKVLMQAKCVERVEWSAAEDKRLSEAVALYGDGKWTKIAKHVDSKGPRQCMFRYRNTLKDGIQRGKWLQDEDARLLNAVKMFGTRCWKKIAEDVRTRTDFQCRERYMHNLDPNINKSPWTNDEDCRLLYFVEEYGSNKWSDVSRLIGTRSDVQCRRRYIKLVTSNRRSRDDLQIFDSHSQT